MSDSSDSEDSIVVKKRKDAVVSVITSRRGLWFALFSGILAAVAGTFGKLAMAKTEALWLCDRICPYALCDKIALYIQIASFITMILVNTIMTTMFVKALRYCKTSMEATITNTAANFLFSALVGHLIFDECVTLLWWLGTLLIIFGFALMNHGHGKSNKGRRTKKYKSR